METINYEKRKLIAKEGNVYDEDGKYIFGVTATNRALELLDNDGWKKGEESWLDYRKRTEHERELEKKKQYQLAKDLVSAYNSKFL